MFSAIHSGVCDFSNLQPIKMSVERYGNNKLKELQTPQELYEAQSELDEELRKTRSVLLILLRTPIKKRTEFQIMEHGMLRKRIQILEKLIRGKPIVSSDYDDSSDEEDSSNSDDDSSPLAARFSKLGG